MPAARCWRVSYISSISCLSCYGFLDYTVQALSLIFEGKGIVEDVLRTEDGDVVDKGEGYTVAGASVDFYDMAYTILEFLL